MYQTNYAVDNSTNTMVVDRIFDAPLPLVWQAWTDSAILDKWWAPQPWKTETKIMSLIPGGRWLYAMKSPQGEKHWSLAEFTEIVPQQFFAYESCFCDENGNPVLNMDSTHWHVEFTAQEATTRVVTTLTFVSAAALEKMVAMGFKEGFAMGHQNLDAYLQAQFKLWSQLKTNTKARVSTYLNFAGNTEAAFNFYKSVFGTEFNGNGIQRFGDIPLGDGYPPIIEEVKKMVLHVELPIMGGHILMATDAPKEMGMTVTTGNNMHICLEPETRAEAERLFEALSKEGKITMPLADMFFGAYFGEFTDQYGVNWMINCTEKK